VIEIKSEDSDPRLRSWIEIKIEDKDWDWNRDGEQEGGWRLRIGIKVGYWNWGRGFRLGMWIRSMMGTKIEDEDRDQGWESRLRIARSRIGININIEDGHLDNEWGSKKRDFDLYPWPLLDPRFRSLPLTSILNLDPYP
jgi:hypothetical protein